MKVYEFAWNGEGSYPAATRRWSEDPETCGVAGYEPTGESRELAPDEEIDSCGQILVPPVKEYLSAIGRKGGQATSEKKARSSAENGKKGGRPRKTTA